MKINTDPMNMDALDFDGDMWDPEYCDSELRAVEASGELRDELCPCQQTQLKLNRWLTGGTRVTGWRLKTFNKYHTKPSRVHLVMHSDTPIASCTNPTEQ